MNSQLKEKKNPLSLKKVKKVRINWKQSLRTVSAKGRAPKRIKKSLQYLLLLKKFNQQIDYKNVKLLKAFLTKFGKIRSRKKTRIPLQKQRAIARAIRKARAFQLLPFTCDVIL